MSDDTVGLIFVNFNSATLIRDSLRTIGANHQVVVVDNFHSDTAREEVRKSVPPGVTLLEQENNGFAAGVNAANRHLDSSLAIVLLNPDAAFAEGHFDDFVSRARERRADIVSPRILDGDGRRIWFDGGTVGRISGEVRHSHFGEIVGESSDYTTTQFVSGCALYLSPHAREVVLPMSEDLFMYYEDVELSHAASRARMKMWVDRDALVFHDEGNTSRAGGETRSPLFYYFQARNRLIAEIQAPRVLRMLVTPIVVTRSAARILVRERPRVSLLQALLRGTADGLRGRRGRRGA